MCLSFYIHENCSHHQHQKDLLQESTLTFTSRTQFSAEMEPIESKNCSGEFVRNIPEIQVPHSRKITRGYLARSSVPSSPPTAVERLAVELKSHAVNNFLSVPVTSLFFSFFFCGNVARRIVHLNTPPPSREITIEGRGTGERYLCVEFTPLLYYLC